MANPYIIETALIAHLSAQIAQLADVGSFDRYRSKVDMNDYPPLPSVYVTPDEAEVTDSDQNFQVEEQLWIVSVLVDNSPDSADTDTTAIKAGSVIEEVMAALIGWRPELSGNRLAGFKPMKYAGKSTPVYAPGFTEFPVLFSTGLVLTGSGNN